MTAISKTLSAQESERLAELEPIIEQGLKSFVEVGSALKEISDSRLYRATHSTFQDYVIEKHGISARRAYQLSEAAEVVKKLQPNVNHGSQINERQARELVQVPQHKRAAILEDVAKEGPITAKAIREKAARKPKEKQSDFLTSKKEGTLKPPSTNGAKLPHTLLIIELENYFESTNHLLAYGPAPKFQDVRTKVMEIVRKHVNP